MAAEIIDASMKEKIFLNYHNIFQSNIFLCFAVFTLQHFEEKMFLDDNRGTYKEPLKVPYLPNSLQQWF